MAPLVTWHVSLCGWMSHRRGLAAIVALAPAKPPIISDNETFLTLATEEVAFPGFREVARRDRVDKESGGVLVVVRTELEECTA